MISVTVFTVLTGAVLIPYQLSEVERVRELRSQQKSSEQQRTSPISGGSVRKADFDEQGSRRYVAPLVDLEKEVRIEEHVFFDIEKTDGIVYF